MSKYQITREYFRQHLDTRIKMCNQPGIQIAVNSSITGSKEFVAENYRRFKHLFYSKHEKKPKLIKGLEGMYSLKRLSEMI